MQINDIRNIGNILYLDDACNVSASAAGLTATIPISVDSRFTITTMGSTASNLSIYQIQATNCNPYITMNPYNQNLNYFENSSLERIIINPDFQNSWNTIGSLGVSGNFECTSYYRFIRIINNTSIETSFKAFIFAEKQMPVIQ